MDGVLKKAGVNGNRAALPELEAELSTEEFRRGRARRGRLVGVGVSEAKSQTVLSN